MFYHTFVIVSFLSSAHLWLGVHLWTFQMFRLFSRTTEPILTKLITIIPRFSGLKVFRIKSNSLFRRGDNTELNICYDPFTLKLVQGHCTLLTQTVLFLRNQTGLRVGCICLEFFFFTLVWYDHLKSMLTLWPKALCG